MKAIKGIENEKHVQKWMSLVLLICFRNNNNNKLIM